MGWKLSSSPRKTFEVTPSAGKVLVTVFWGSSCVFLVDFLEKGCTVYASKYCTMLKSLQKAISRKVLSF
jgi:hypothetical protein